VQISGYFKEVKCIFPFFFFFPSYNHTNHFELDGQINIIFNQSNIEFIYMFYSMYIVGTVYCNQRPRGRHMEDK
jgi:hypothetical protein